MHHSFLHIPLAGGPNTFDVSIISDMLSVGGWVTILILVLVLLLAAVGIGLCIRLMGSQSHGEIALPGVVALVLLGVAGSTAALLVIQVAAVQPAIRSSTSMPEAMPTWDGSSSVSAGGSTTPSPTTIGETAGTMEAASREKENTPTPSNLVAPQKLATRLLIPAIDVDAPIVRASVVGKTWDISEIYDEIAYLEGTAYPGGPGNAVLAGHATHLRGDGPFLHLSQLAAGDIIVVEGDGIAYVYRVLWVKTTGKEDIEVAYATTPPTLTLITCAQWDRDTNAYKKRLIVRAELIGRHEIEVGADAAFSR